MIKTKEFLNIKVETPYDFQTERSFDESEVKKTIRGIFDDGSEYIFVRTVANPKAVDSLAKTTMKRIDFFPSLEAFEKMHTSQHRTEDENKRNIKEEGGKKIQLRFNTGLMTEYLGVLEKMAHDRLGKKCYAQFPIVQNKGVHIMDRRRDQINWPIIHILRDRPISEFKKIIEGLNGEEGYKHLEEIESPHYYQMGYINHLRKKGISPLLLEERTWKVGAAQLKDSVDFLCHYVYSESSRDHSFSED